MPDSQSIIGDLYLGIDVGGTNVKLGLVDDAGVIHDRHQTATPPLGTPKRVFEYAIQYANEKLAELNLDSSRLVATGLAVPGVLDTQAFVLREVVNLPGWLEVPLLEQLKTVSQLPSAVVNDANSAAFAEHAHRNLGNQSLALVTLGTGVGAGMVIAGNPHGGDHGCAGELGHVAIEFGDDAIACTCGSRGHLESYAGAGGVVARLNEMIRSGAEVPEYLKNSEVTPREIARAASDGNAACREIIRQTGEYVGRAIGYVGQVADPAVVLLGGAMTFGGSESETGQAFLDAVRQSVKDTTLVQVGGNIKIEFATLGNDAGMLGAAVLAKHAAT